MEEEMEETKSLNLILKTIGWDEPKYDLGEIPANSKRIEIYLAGNSWEQPVKISVCPIPSTSATISPSCNPCLPYRLT
jgi:hypothetical protein